MDLATGSVFFPFTEPTVYSPITRKKVSGDDVNNLPLKEEASNDGMMVTVH